MTDENKTLDISSMTLEQVQAELARLQKENEYLKVLDTIAPAQGVDMWGRPRAPLTDEDRARFKAWNAKYGRRASPEMTQADENLALVAKLHNAREENERLRKKKKR